MSAASTSSLSDPEKQPAAPGVREVAKVPEHARKVSLQDVDVAAQLTAGRDLEVDEAEAKRVRCVCILSCFACRF